MGLWLRLRPRVWITGARTQRPVLPHPVARRPSDDGEAAVGPELPLRAEAVGRHDDGQHLGHAHGAEAGCSLQDSGNAMPVGFSEHGELSLGLESLELLELTPHKLDGLTGCRGKGTSPLHAFLRLVHGLSRAGQAARAEEALEPELHANQVARDHRVGTGAIPQRREKPYILVHRPIDLSRAEFLREPMCIDRVAFHPRLPPALVDHELGHIGGENLAEPLAPFTLLDTEVQLARDLLQVADQGLPVGLHDVAP